MSVNIDQAFIDSFIDNDFGLEIAHENLAYSPSPGTEYVELLNIPNDITPLSLTGSDETDGIFRIILRWPVDDGSINAKTKADEIMSAFKIGTQVCYNGQCSTVTRQARQKGFNESGWYKILITIGYHAILVR